jgi:hypothetical protein
MHGLQESARSCLSSVESPLAMAPQRRYREEQPIATQEHQGKPETIGYGNHLWPEAHSDCHNKPLGARIVTQKSTESPHRRRSKQEH